jgi:xylulokinase
MSDDRLIAGVDAGTTRIRVLVFTPDGRVVAEGSRSTPVARPRPGWAEHDAEALWAGGMRRAFRRHGSDPAPGPHSRHRGRELRRGLRRARS